MVKPTLLYRIASVLLVVFAAGHTFGFLKFKPPTPEGLGVWEGMNNVHFQIGKSTYTYASFYNGFGLFATLYLVFAAFLAWHLGNVARNQPQAIGAVARGAVPPVCGLRAVAAEAGAASDSATESSKGR